MAKRKIIKKRKTPVNIYADGAFMNKSRNAWGDFKGSSFQGKAGAIGSIGGAVTDMIGAGLNNAQISDTSNIQEEIDNTKSTVVGSNDFDSLMGEWGTWSPLERVNWRDIRGTKGGQQAMNTINASVSGASAGMQVGGPLGAIIGGAAGAIGGIAGSIRGRRKAKREARRLNREIEAANEQSLLALEDRADAIDTQNDLIALSNYAAKGGFINRFERGGNTNKARRIDFENYKPLYDRGFIPANMNELQDSLINRGYKEPQRLAILSNVLHESGADPLAVDKTGKYKGGLQWDSTRHPGTDKWNKQISYIIKEATTPETPYWSDGGGGIPYIKNLKDGFINFWNAGNPYDATLYYTKGNVRPSEEEARVNRAKEAQNMFKNLKAEGGSMNPQFNGMFPNDVTYIGNGGTHEQNPYDGVQLGVDNQGVPNMVEEGEVVWEDYVFSNRLKPTKEFKDKYKVKGDTFADVAKYIQKESSERPNDPISKLGLKDSLGKLQLEQEQVRSKNKKINSNDKHLFSKGGSTIPIEIEDPTQTREVVLPIEVLLNSRSFEPIPSVGIELPTKLSPIRELTKRDKKRASRPLPDSFFKDESDSGYKDDWLRYAPVYGSAVGVMNDLFSRPDYSNAKAIERAANKAGVYTPVSYTPVGNYLEYKPLDRNYYLNKLQSSSNASRRAIVDQSNGNRATAVAGILASDYNTQSKIGDLIRQAEEYNLAQRQHVEDFNRNTNATNSKMAMQASLANQEARAKAAQQRMVGITTAAQLRDSIDASRSAARSANLTSLFDNLAGIAIDKDNRAARDFYIENVMAGRLPLAEYARIHGKDKAIAEAKERGLTDEEIDSIFKKYGGKINRKKKGGFTY